MTVGRPAGPVSDTWTVAIHASASDWKPVGTGVLIDSHRVLTCAHVAAKAQKPGGEVFVAFPKLETMPHRRRVSSVLLPQEPPTEVADAAVLVLESAAPDGAVPAPLRDPPMAGVVGGDWWAFGYPNSDILGSSARCGSGTRPTAGTWTPSPATPIGWARYARSRRRMGATFGDRILIGLTTGLIALDLDPGGVRAAQAP